MKEDLIYLAGLFDGEGTITLTKPTSNQIAAKTNFEHVFFHPSDTLSVTS